MGGDRDSLTVPELEGRGREPIGKPQLRFLAASANTPNSLAKGMEPGSFGSSPSRTGMEFRDVSSINEWLHYASEVTLNTWCICLKKLSA
jgi:hypothetical protein